MCDIETCDLRPVTFGCIPFGCIPALGIFVIFTCDLRPPTCNFRLANTGSKSVFSGLAFSLHHPFEHLPSEIERFNFRSAIFGLFFSNPSISSPPAFQNQRRPSLTGSAGQFQKPPPPLLLLLRFSGIWKRRSDRFSPTRHSTES